MYFIAIVGTLGILLVLLSNRFSDRHKSGLMRKYIAAPIEMLGIFLIGIVAFIITGSIVLPIIVAILHTLF